MAVEVVRRLLRACQISLCIEGVPRTLIIASFNSNKIELAVVANLYNDSGQSFSRAWDTLRLLRLVILWFELTAAKKRVELKPGFVVEQTVLLLADKDTDELLRFLRLPRERTSCHSPPSTLLALRS